jgi:N-acylneuraminate cytidylyltransferase
MKTLAIIPARGGSKRIPDKNIKYFYGKPIIAHSVCNALGSGLFDKVVVSTDSLNIAETAKTYGNIDVFWRSKKDANDKSGILDVVKNTLACHNIYDLVCVILATAPLITVNNLKQAKNLLIKHDFDSVLPVVKFEYPVGRGFKLSKNKATMLFPKNYNKRSQDLPVVYHDAGQFYWIQSSKCIEKGRIFTNNTGYIEISSLQAQDIDTEEDWKLCEMKYRINNAY